MKKFLCIVLLLELLAMPLGAVELDPISAADVAETENSQIISMDLLRSSEKVTQYGIQRAKNNMAKTLRGELPKRNPLTVIERGDGTYCIIDGNRTYSALKEMGAKNIPVEIVEHVYVKDVKTIDELYSKNIEAEAEFKALCESLSKELGAKLVMRPGLKSRERTIEKTANKYNGNFSMVTDILAASLIFTSEEKIYEAVDKFKANDSIIFIRDKWRKHPKTNGYRDILTNVMLSNGAIAEIQLHHEGIFEYSMYGGDHYLYEFERSNINNQEMKPYTKRAEDIQRAFFKAAADGKYSTLSKEVKARFIRLRKSYPVRQLRKVRGLFLTGLK